ncbi:MAG: MAPEG family protein [Pseudomonadota bacterium]|nr:MAPEG family protein [Pseudomonadota bacterium]
MSILPVYASLLGLLFVVLSVQTIRVRRRRQIALGDAGDPAMLRAIRVHSNFAEYVPLSLVLIHLVETQLAWPLLVHALGALLLLARLSHAYGVSQARENFRFRIFGMIATFSVLVVSALALLLAKATQLA